MDRLPPYVAGRPIEEVADEFGFDPRSVVKLASNESPLPPFPEVVEAIAAHAGTLNRYPDNGWHEVARAVGEWLDVDEKNLMFAGGSSELLRVFALAVGGAGTSAVYAWPSFIIYRLASVLAESEPIEVPLTADHQLDPEGLVEAIRSDTTVLYLCNPNNPTGSYLGFDRMKEVIDRVGDSALVVIDEAYFDYVTARDYASAIPEALARPNVVVTRTFRRSSAWRACGSDLRSARRRLCSNCGEHRPHSPSAPSPWLPPSRPFAIPTGSGSGWRPMKPGESGWLAS